MSIEDWNVKRLYKCSNKECSAKFVIEQTVTEDFLKHCGECGQDTLLIESGKAGGDAFMGPKTLGMLAEKNRTQKDKYLSPEEKSGFRKRGVKALKEKTKQLAQDLKNERKND